MKPHASTQGIHRRVCGNVAALLCSVGACFALAATPANAMIFAVCGDASGDGSVASSDAWLVLRAAVGVGTCVPSRCDADASGSVTATDAVSILKCAVGVEIALSCPPEDLPTSTTTSTSTTTTLAGVCGDGTIDAGEDCEPTESFCRGGCNPWTGICVDFMCSDDCRCPKPLCGDDMIDTSEDCDPPGSPCEDGGTCGVHCGCEH